MKIAEIASLFRKELTSIYPADEIEAFIFFTLNEYLGFTRSEIVKKAEYSLSNDHIDQFKAIITQLKQHKPIQYLVGSTEFYKLKIKVNEHVLIPRPETEELVELIINDHRNSTAAMKILDIGTGSGCIAITLKKNIPNASITAIDISEQALIIAKQNAELNNTVINFMRQDILQPVLLINKKYNIIVSNPPYVCQSEKNDMSKNVLENEPSIALFVPNEDALLFYKAIADFSLHHLSINGILYFEINKQYGAGVMSLLVDKGFVNVVLKKDLSGNDRIVIAQLPYAR